MIFVLMVLDGLSPPIGLTSVTARANGTNLIMEGRYQAGAATPLLVWPRSTEPWANPCSKATDLCCLREINVKHRNDALSSVQGSACLKGLPPNLVAGSRPFVTSTATSFNAIVPILTPWVAILFLHPSPFFILDGYQAFRIDPASNVESNLVIPHNPCYSVVVPGTLASVCMQCNNKLPANARYVWTQSWYNDYTCDWQCLENYVRSDLTCEPAQRQVPLLWIIVGACAAVAILLLVIYCTLSRAHVTHVEPDEPPQHHHHHTHLRSDMIQFKDGNVLIPLRIKAK